MTAETNEIDVMRKFLIVAIEGAGVANAPSIRWDHGGSFFSIEGTDIEIAREAGGASGYWRVRAVYAVADLKEGGHRTTGSTVARFEVGDEIAVSRAAILKVIETRLDAALDAAA